MKIFFVQFFCVFLPPLPNIFYLSQFCTISILYCAYLYMKLFLAVSNFLEEISSLSPFYCFPLFLCIVHLGRTSYLSLLFFGTLFSDGYIFPFLCCLLFLFSDICKTSSATFLPFFFYFVDGFDHCLLYNVTDLHPQFFSHSIRSNPLNLFVTSTVKS